MSRIAVLGLGRMGAPLAARLAATGHQVQVWNRGEAGHRRLTAELAAVDTSETHAIPVRTASPAAAVRGAEYIITMLADATALTSVLFGPDGVAEGVASDAVVCDMGTIGVACAQECARRLGTSGVAFLDAPVSGSVPAVRSGTLLVMVGGSAVAFHRVKPVLEVFGPQVHRVGDSGSGQAMKLAVNSVLHSYNAALSESLVLAERGGVDRGTALDILAGSAAAAPYLRYKRAAFEDPQGQPVAFTVDAMVKDLHLIRGLAAGCAAPVPVVETVLAICGQASSAGLGDQDMSAIAEHHRANHG